MSKSIILLEKSFLGKFYRHLAIYFWSHWLGQSGGCVDLLSRKRWRLIKWKKIGYCPSCAISVILQFYNHNSLRDLICFMHHIDFFAILLTQQLTTWDDTSLHLLLLRSCTSMRKVLNYFSRISKISWNNFLQETSAASRLAKVSLFRRFLKLVASSKLKPLTSALDLTNVIEAERREDAVAKYRQYCDAKTGAINFQLAKNQVKACAFISLSTYFAYQNNELAFKVGRPYQALKVSGYKEKFLLSSLLLWTFAFFYETKKEWLDSLIRTNARQSKTKFNHPLKTSMTRFGEILKFFGNFFRTYLEFGKMLTLLLQKVLLLSKVS